MSVHAQTCCKGGRRTGCEFKFRAIRTYRVGMLRFTKQQPLAAPHSALSHTGTSLGSNYWCTNALELQQKDGKEFPIKNP